VRLNQTNSVFDVTSKHGINRLQEQLQVSRNNLKMAKSTLRELSLKAVIEFRGRTTLSAALKNLRNDNA
jgi:hypothetical protein